MTDRLPILFIGNKNYSSWSMRPWLVLRWAGIEFEEVMIPLGPRGGGINPAIAAISPSATLPALHLPKGEVIWDTMAICEWAHEQKPEAHLWPANPIARALARSASAEMHAGFVALRQNMPMNLRRRKHDHEMSAATVANIARVDALLAGLRARFDKTNSGWLFGAPTIADAFFAPVATRFRTYNTPLHIDTHIWCDAIFADPDFQDWEAAALVEPQTIPETDVA
jgi:glutathione S-transferase